MHKLALGALLCLASAPALAQFSYATLTDERTKTTVQFSDEASGMVFAGGTRKGIGVLMRAERPCGECDHGDEWTLTIAPPRDEELHRGLWAEVTCGVAPRGRAMAVYLRRNGEPNHCGTEDTVHGWVAIKEISWLPDGQLRRVALAFKYQVGSERTPGLLGTVEFRTPPQTLRMTSSKRAPWGGGTILAQQDTSLFDASGAARQALVLDASLIRQAWRFEVAPPIGQPLEPGQYAATQDGSAGHRFTISKNGQPLRCPNGRPLAGTVRFGAGASDGAEHDSGWIEFDMACPGRVEARITGTLWVDDKLSAGID